MINCALIGYGSWGKIIYRNIIANKNLNLKVIFYNKSIDAKNINSNIKISNNYIQFNYSKIRLIFIAVNSEKNYDLCKFFLLKKINVFIEKPITTNKKKIDELILLAKKNNCILHVDYIHLFNKNFLIFRKKVLNVMSINSKFNLKIIMGSNLSRVNQIDSYWDWGVHVFSILSNLISIDYQKLILLKKKSKNSSKVNYVLKFNINNNLLELNFGNNFKEKKILVSYKDKFNHMRYYDKYYMIKNKKYNSILHFDDTPLQQSFDMVVQNIFKNRVYQCRTSKKITFTMEKIINKYNES